MSIEKMAQAMYESKYAAMGGRWELNETKEVWYAYARAALSALSSGEAMEAAACAFAGIASPPECGRDEPHISNSCSACQRVAAHEDVVERLAAAAPLLVAPHLAEIEKLRGENNERQERLNLLYAEEVRWIEKLESAERERDALKAALGKYGMHHGYCPQLRALSERGDCTCGFADALGGGK